MNWTSEKPTQEGYYWYKPVGDEQQTASENICSNNEPIIVRYLSRGKIVCLIHHMDECSAVLPQQMNGQLYGPIEPPA